MMNSYYCPYLGKDGDSETAIGFAHASNRCFAGETPLAIKIDYQERYCLVPNHRSCNVYLQNPVSLPGETQPSDSAPPTYDSNGLGDDGDINPPTQPGNAGDSTQPVSLADTGPIPVQEPPQDEVDYRRPAKAPREEPSKGFSLPEISFSEPNASKKAPPAKKKPAPDKKRSERSEDAIEEEARQHHLPPSPEKPLEEKTSSQNDHYEPGSIAPPRPKDGGKRQSPPRPGKIPGLEAYGPQSYGPQSYGPQKNGNGQKRYGPGDDDGRKRSKAERRQKSKAHQQSSKKTSDGTRPVNVKKSAPITSPRKRLNWLTILEVLMGIVVLGGIVLVIWLMISLIPGNTGSGLIFPPIIASTATATEIDSEAVPPVLTETPEWTSTPTTMPTLTPTLAFTATLTATQAPPTATEAQTQGPPEDCDIPEGWVPYTVQSGDVLVNLAEFFGLTLQELQEGNCMEEETLIYPGDVIYLPDINAPTPTPTEES
jgi:hypothetical protein